MTLEQLYNSLETLNPDDREKLLIILFDKFLSPLSVKMLKKFQDDWGYTGSNWKAFVKKQNLAIKKCIDVELSEKAQGIRKKLGLVEFTWDTVVE